MWIFYVTTVSNGPLLDKNEILENLWWCFLL